MEENNILKEYTEEELMNAYMGKTAETLKNKFNWIMALINTLFASIWYLYNKAYVCFLLTQLTSFFIPAPIMFLINGFLGEDFYKKEIKRKIKKIKKKNSNLTNEELINLLKEKGKKNKILTIIYVIIGSLILLTIVGIIILMALSVEILTGTYVPTFLDKWL